MDSNAWERAMDQGKTYVAPFLCYSSASELFHSWEWEKCPMVIGSFDNHALWKVDEGLSVPIYLDDCKQNPGRTKYSTSTTFSISATHRPKHAKTFFVRYSPNSSAPYLTFLMRSLSYTHNTVQGSFVRLSET
jgi:hypothetical protein